MGTAIVLCSALMHTVRHAQAQPPIAAPVAEKSIVSIVAKSSPRPLPADQPDPVAIWTKAAADRFQSIRDYQCMFVKQEQIEGKLQEEQVAQMAIRNHPFSVHLKFQAPKAMAGREAVYVTGKNNGKMKAKGALGLVGFIALDPQDPKAKLGTHHAITEAGLGHLIEELMAAQAKMKGAGSTAPQMLYSDVTVNRHECLRIEVIDAKTEGKSPHRSVLYFDRENGLPIRVERYNRPASEGAAGELIECFTYLDLRLNVGLTDAAFP